MDVRSGTLRYFGKQFEALKPDYYYDHYDRFVTVDREQVAAVLELGIANGGSLLMWMAFFPRAQIFGVDLREIHIDEQLKRMHALKADQTDSAAIGQFLNSHGVDALDVIIDDCSHLGLPTKKSFWYLFETFLKPGGFYVIEDWGTGYQEDWPDGAAPQAPDPADEEAGIFHSHEHGIPGFIKQLVDERKKIESITITSAFAVIKKQSIENAKAIARARKLWTEQHAV